jgi:hypothetical protein
MSLPPIDPVSISMYDTANKKLVAVFSSIIIASRYVFDSRAEKHTETIARYIRHKYRMNHNRFGRVVCFRHATVKQQELLAGGTHIILDELFDRKVNITLKFV